MSERRKAERVPGASMSPDFMVRLSEEGERVAREPMEGEPFPDAWRCRTCRWWRDSACGRMEIPGDAAPVWASDEEGYRVFPIFTDADFGCTQWQPKED